MTDATVMKQVQFGWETTFGTPVTPTVKLLGVGDISFTPNNETKRFPDLRGSMAPAYKGALVRKAGAGKISGVLYHETLAYILVNMFGSVAATGTGPYVYAYNAPLTTVPTRKPWTIVYGTSGGTIERVTSALITSLTIKQQAFQECTFDLEFEAQVQDTGTLAALTDLTPTIITGDQWTVALDLVGGTMGATAITTSSMGFTLKISSPVTLEPRLGALTSANYSQKGWDAALDAELALDAVGKAQYQAVIDAAALLEQQVELKATSGTVISKLQFAGGYKHNPEGIGDTDGVQSVKLGWEAIYNTTFGNYMKVNLTNGLTTIP